MLVHAAIYLLRVSRRVPCLHPYSKLKNSAGKLFSSNFIRGTIGTHVNGGNSRHVGNCRQRQFLQQIGFCRHLCQRESYFTAACSIPYWRRCQRQPIRCKNCHCLELPLCPEFPPFTLYICQFKEQYHNSFSTTSA